MGEELLKKDYYVKNEYRSTRVCIDAYAGKRFQGRLYNPFFAEERSFDNLMQLLLLVEELLEKMAFPQPFTEQRTFWKARGAQGAEQALPADAAIGKDARGKLATFQIKVVFRQNASWQGTVNWLEQNTEENFRSVWELVRLIDSALSLDEA